MASHAQANSCGFHVGIIVIGCFSVSLKENPEPPGTSAKIRAIKKLMNSALFLTNRGEKSLKRSKRGREAMR